MKLNDLILERSGEINESLISGFSKKVMNMIKNKFAAKMAQKYVDMAGKAWSKASEYDWTAEDRQKYEEEFMKYMDLARKEEAKIKKD